MEEWIAVAEFNGPGPELDKEMTRIEDLALDVALRPDLVIRVQEVKGRMIIEVHRDFYGFYQG